MSKVKMLPESIELGIDRKDMAVFAVEINIDVDESWDDRQLASEIISKIDAMNDAEWDGMTVELKEWSNSINEAKLKIDNNEKATKAAKPKATKAAKPKATKAAKPKATKAAKPKAKTTEEILQPLKKKDEIIEAASGIASELGIEIDLKKSWTVAKLKDQAGKQLSKKTAKAEKPSKSKTAVKADAKAKSPSAQRVKEAKAKAKAKATEGAASAARGKGLVDGEPYRRGTTAWLVWDAFKRTKKAGLTLEQATTMFMATFKKSGLKSGNPEGRVKRVIADMMGKGILSKTEDKVYSLM